MKHQDISSTSFSGKNQKKKQTPQMKLKSNIFVIYSIKS